MKVKVRYYSAHREITKKVEEIIEIHDKATLNELLEKLTGMYPEMKKIRESTLISLNHKYAKGDEKIKDGDEIALFPPVEGG